MKQPGSSASDPHTQDTPIIFVTAISTAEVHITKGYSLGAVDYILTPIVPDTLRAKVKVFVDLFQKNQELERNSIALHEANQILEHHLSEIERLNTDLELTNQDLISFSHSVSHDLRAPLRHIEGFTTMLKDSYADKLDERGKVFFDRILNAARTANNIIEDLLKLSRITQQSIERSNVNLSQIASDICESLKSSQPERKTEFVMTNDVHVNADPGLMSIVLENLLNNAWKYSGKQPESRIEFRRADYYGKETYFVRENGVGFDSSTANQLFIPFKRFHSMSDFPGTGIGLATVYRIIRRHGGRIWAESEIDKGATFYFTLG